MKPELQRIAIAKACGWELVASNSKAIESGQVITFPDMYFLDSEDCGCFEELLPDYLNDLNAMHEAEKRLVGDQRSKYMDELCFVMDIPIGDFNPIFATASQKAEAFLNTLGLWKEPPSTDSI